MRNLISFVCRFPRQICDPTIMHNRPMPYWSSYSTSINSFDEAKEAVNNLKTEPNNEMKLHIYALFKQATFGDCKGPKPNALSFVASAKWKAWNSLNSMTKVSYFCFYSMVVISPYGGFVDFSTGKPRLISTVSLPLAGLVLFIRATFA